MMITRGGAVQFSKTVVTLLGVPNPFYGQDTSKLFRAVARLVYLLPDKFFTGYDVDTLSKTQISSMKTSQKRRKRAFQIQKDAGEQ